MNQAITGGAASDALDALAARLRLLEDTEAIRALLASIARGTDRFDQKLLARCVAPDAVLDLGGSSAMTGGSFVAVLAPPAETRPGRMHLIANEHITIDGDSARAETYLISCQDVLSEDQRKTRIRAGRYIDRFARRQDGWVLVARVMIDEWSRIDAVGDAVAPGGNVGRPAPDDVSYTI